MIKAIVNFLRDEEGASAVEYGLLIGLIAVALITVLGLVSGGLQNLFTDVANELTGVGGP